MLSASKDARDIALKRLVVLDSGMSGGIKKEGKDAIDFKDGRDALAEKNYTKNSWRKQRNRIVSKYS